MLPVLLVPLALLLELFAETLLEPPPPPQPATSATAAANVNAPSARTSLLSISKMVLLDLVRYWMSVALTPAGSNCGR